MNETELVAKAVDEDYFAGNMTLRDWFAGHALAGILASMQFIPRPHLIAEAAFEYADAMLKKSNLES